MGRIAPPPLLLIIAQLSLLYHWSSISGASSYESDSSLSPVALLPSQEVSAACFPPAQGVLALEREGHGEEMSPLSKDTADRIRAALWGLFIGDALAMPVHWYYDRRRLRNDFGTITGYRAPPASFPGSIMNLSNTGGGGRGSDAGSIVGDVILHGKKKFWMRGGSYHYHHGMEAGENTLEAQLTRLLMRHLTEQGGNFVKSVWLQSYIQFMTTPGSHNDTYASTAHRMFFANFQKGKKPEDCADNDGHNTDAIDGLTLLPPVILMGLWNGRGETESAIESVIGSLRRSRVLGKYGSMFARLMVQVLEGRDLQAVLQEVGREGGVDIKREVNESSEDPMTACYIDSSFPAFLHFAYKYAHSFEACLLANANAGGENVARGSLLGALLGAAHGMQGIPDHLIQGLAAREAIQVEIEKYISTLEMRSRA